VQAFDRYGQIVRVEYFANQVKVGEATVHPYGLTWSNPPPGACQITAVATDNFGASTTSTPVWVSFGGPALLPPAATAGGLYLAWPVSEQPYQLEFTTGMNPPDWQPLPQAASSSNGLWQIIVPLDGPQRFFRLRSP
jgi:hypothetical protein